MYRHVSRSILLLLLLASPATSQLCDSSAIDFIPGSSTVPASLNCSSFLSCHQAQLSGAQYELVPSDCDPTMSICAVRATVPATFPGNHQNTSSNFPDSPVKLIWTNGSGGYVGSCGNFGQRIQNDDGVASIAISFACGDGDSNGAAQVYTLTARTCDGAFGCTVESVQTVDFTQPSLEGLFCPEAPPEYTCPQDGGCLECLPGSGSDGGPGAGPAGDGPGAAPPGSGPGARLYYKARGTGHFAHPMPGWWNDRLGQHWSHDYAETLVPQPLEPENPGDPTADLNHMWLLTRFATFRQFRDFDEDGVFDFVQPGDEFRQLVRTATGYELSDLDGTVQFFDTTGLWQRTVDRNGNATIATYGEPGELLKVAFPDGRKETFTYHGDKKLATIAEVGVDGVTSRTWSYIWAGLSLLRIDRPDGTAWRFSYGQDGFSRLILEGTDGSERVLRAWDYDLEGNVSEVWRGAPTFDDPAATEKWRLLYDNMKRPTRTFVTDPLGDVSIYELEWKGNRPVVTRLEDSCPRCGSGPNAVLSYTGLHPTRPSLETNGRGTVTRYTYDANGQMTSRIEAFGDALERETTWQYDPTYPAFPVRQTQPSATGDPLDERVSAMTYDAAGNRTTTTIEGFENGDFFVYQTTMTHNAAGQPLVIDPPGHGTADQTTFTYDPARGDLIPLTRTDPIVGTTTFGYDVYNRRISVTDPNGTVTETVYDDLDRVRFLIQRGATAEDDLVTEHRYNVFGDLFQTVLPEGNVIEYLYDSVGRLTSVERKPDDDPNSHGERTVYVLDGFGNRVREEQQRWRSNSLDWVVDSATEYVYSSRCHLDQVIEGPGTAPPSTTEYGYDCAGNLERVWDANHPSNGGVNPPSTTYVYDALDRLTTVRQPWEAGGDAVTSYGYDVQDHLVGVTDAEGNTTTYAYSDRDLLTRETSPVSGQTTYTYDEHGELSTETDARGVTVTRTVDALDRVTFVDFPDDALDITYTYDDPAVAFSIGRLTRIERDGHAIDHAYDRFGRTTQDGALKFVYDRNGNRTEIEYPGGVKAHYTHDFADRPSTLTVEDPAQGLQPWVTFARYHAAGPLRRLDFASGLRETRLYDQRYHPTRITAGSVLDWTYSTDAVGNITSIQDGLDPTQNRTYSYVDTQYFLRIGDGPWGALSWTYDKIGNRLTETRDGVVDTYSYEPGVSGNTPKLEQIALGAGGTKTFDYDAIGSQTRITGPIDTVDYLYDNAKRLTAIETASGQERTDLAYEGRSFLRSSVASKPFELLADDFELGNLACWSNVVGGPTGGVCPTEPVTEPTYTSDGLLMHVSGAEDRHVLYFAGRPVGILFEGLLSSVFLTTDHLGTPVLASTGAGASFWDGGFEPFGADFSGAQDAGVFLRFPGQWEDVSWSGVGGYYNVHRWYAETTGRYNRPDPLGFRGGINLFSYVHNNSINRIDPLGLMPRPLPPSRRQTRLCNSEEFNTCAAICGTKGVESCRVSQTFGVVRHKDGKTLWRWADGPMSCSCNEPEEPICRRRPGTCIAIGTAVCVLVLSPWPDDVLIPVLLALP